MQVSLQRSILPKNKEKLLPFQAKHTPICLAQPLNS